MYNYTKIATLHISHYMALGLLKAVNGYKIMDKQVKLSYNYILHALVHISTYFIASGRF